ncbi:hypothetical protein CEXT_421061 [Caerostris extrusa]|uniref:Transmembrane protein n=1 Tax=Caerostris extrusa TaxID=172846 RepID=A0AAV4S4B2_CAEEX|nr:hypothetical protein CEXT_421061 [Caerostris extrusa]
MDQMELLTPTNSIYGRHDGPRPPSQPPRTRRREFRSSLNESERIVERLRTKNAGHSKGAGNSVRRLLLFIQTQVLVYLAGCRFFFFFFVSLDYSTYANEKDPPKCLLACFVH